MTRWHEGDLAGRLIGAMEDGPEADQWHVLQLPALAEAGDALSRAEGKALCSELGFDERCCKPTRASLGSYWWAALYQQRCPPRFGTRRGGYWSMLARGIARVA